MKFNPSKCNIMRLECQDLEPGNPSYTMLGTNLKEKPEITYLRVIIQNDLSWNKQTEYAASKATRILNFIMRNFSPDSRTIKEKLYFTLVRPHHEYGSVAWNPYSVKNISSLEKVQ